MWVQGQRKGKRMELIKPRYELINARCRKGWTEVELAERIKPKPNVETVRRWEAGIRTPQPHFIEQLCDLFGAKHPKESTRPLKVERKK